MIVQEVTVRVEADVVGGTPRLTVTQKGIAHPHGVIALANAAIGWALQQIAQAEEAALKAKMASGDGLRIVGADGKPIQTQ